ncbi:MAG: glycosyltransferase [Methylococcaceae bacterium]|nr:glycosyltransferase [Methylococcaceae bacterium]
MKPRIAHVINSFGLGGVPQVAYQMMRSLPNDTYELYLYVLKSYPDNGAVRQQLSDYFRNMGVIVRCPDRDEKKFYVVSQLCHWIKDDCINIVHTHSYKPNIYGRLAATMCRFQGLKTVAHYHNFYENKWIEDDSIVYEQFLARTTDCFLACSGSVAKHAAEKIGLSTDSFEVILNGIDLDRFKIRTDRAAIKSSLCIPEDFNVVGIVGRISQQKAQDIFLEAAAKIHQRSPQTLFLIVGAADEPAILDKMMALMVSLGLQEKVRFLGYRDDIPSIYSIIDILVMPSRWEGFGLALVEAMAMGLPIVCSEVGGIPEVVIPNETALFVETESPGQVADALTRLLEDQSLRFKMGQAGKKRAEQFSYQRIGLQVHQKYQQLLYGHKEEKRI